VCRAEPFQGDDSIVDSDFLQRLKTIVDQNKDIAGKLTNHLTAPQITSAMTRLRACTLDERKATYSADRITDQLEWYVKKASFNKSTSKKFFWILIAINGVAIVFAALRIALFDLPFWPTDVFIAAAASLLSWMQAKRFAELSVSYALTAHEISLIREQSQRPRTENEFSQFVGDAENAFSREHTQWAARRDV
jgi:hypothetical protein